MKPTSIYSTYMRTEWRFDNAVEAIWWAIALRLKLPKTRIFRINRLVYTNTAQDITEL
jgi:hypothetical protein